MTPLYAIFLALALLLPAAPAHALDVHTPIAAYRHDVFDARTNAPRNAIAMAQTADGWLWFGTPSGLYRFDGVRFEAFHPARGERLLGQYVTGLMAHPNGELWIGYLYGGISVLRDGHLRHPQPVPGKPIGSAASFAVDGDSVWIAAATGLFRERAGQWQRFGAERGIDTGIARQVYRDHYGRVWAADSGSVYLLDRAGDRFAVAMNVAAEPVFSASPDGRIWAADGETVHSLPAPPDGWRAAPPVTVHGSAQQTLFDRDGNYWVGNCPIGMCVQRPAQRAQVTGGFRDLTAAGARHDGQISKAGVTVTATMEDREGNLWVASTDGVERLRDTRLVPLVLPQPSGWPAMALDGDGALWITSTNMGLSSRLWSMRGARPVEQQPGQRSALVARGLGGTVLVAGERWIERRRGSRVLARYPMPSHTARVSVRDVALLLAEDRDGIWLYYSGKGLLRLLLRGGTWQAPPDATLASAIYAFVDPAGRTWFGTRDNGVVMVDGERRRVYGAGDGIALGAVTFVDATRELVISGDGGAALWQDGRFRPLRAEGVDLANVSGLVASADGDRWLNTRRGLFHVTAEAWRRSVLDPAQALQGTLLDELDGFPGAGYGISPVPTLLLGGDGRLWVSGTDGIAVLDRGHPRRAAAPLHAQVQALVANGRHHEADRPHVLAPRAERLRFDFTAPALGMPERVRFRYRLSGFDHAWIDAGALRSASYTNLGPGEYRFEVQALNEDGVAGPVASMPAIRILPAFTQTGWFVALCGVLVLATAWALYRWKLRRVQAAWQSRMDERLGERERIARTLHDTFLQSLQGLILQLDAVTTRLAPGSSERLRMEKLLASARRVTAEGRNQVQDLREERGPAGLGAAIAASLADLQTDQEVTVSLQQIGVEHPLAPDVQHEAEAIAREAIANVFRHARARSLDITIDWSGAALMLRIADDGVGIAPELLAQGRPGHYGLRGMRERAARIGASLALESSAGAGVTLVLALPARRGPAS